MWSPYTMSHDSRERTRAMVDPSLDRVREHGPSLCDES